MYTEYLFLSTNLKAKLPKLLEKHQWEVLLALDINDLINFLKDTLYAPLLEGYSGILKILGNDLQLFSKTVRTPYWDLMLFEFMIHDIRNDLFQISSKEKVEGYFDLPYKEFYKSLKKEIISKGLNIWQQIGDLDLLNLIIDLEILKHSKEFSNKIENKRIKDFWVFKNKLYWIKIDMRLEKSASQIENLRKLGLDLNFYRLYFRDEDLQQKVAEEVKINDYDLVMRKYLYLYIEKNFKPVVSGPEVVMYYFYNKLWDMEDILFLLENKKAKIPKEYWERGLLKINV